MAKKFYVYTAIPYVNSAPHIGFALEIIQADTIARYHRLLGEDVFFLTGTDENALKNVQAAEEEGITPKELVDKYSAKFKGLKKTLNLSFDDFIRTTETRHVKGAQKFWQACQKDIYQKDYQGWYCVGCEEFKTSKDLIDKQCPEHPGGKIEFVKEKNYFFRLSRYQKQLEKLISSDRLLIVPQPRKKEILNFIRSGLEDFSISRSVARAKGWGIPVPDDPSQIIYVWFDALTNYLTALNYHHNGFLFRKYWLDNKNIVHCIGKGITRFHAVYWPAMLMSAGLTLPSEELIHGYVTVKGQKISKSLGNATEPAALVKKYGSDPLRYYLLAKIPPFTDGDFTVKHFEEVYNADLANGLGNLCQRVAVLAQNSKFKIQNSKVQFKIQNYKQYNEFLSGYRFNECLAWIWKKIARVDKYLDQTRPWEKKGKALAMVLARPIQAIREIAYWLQPFLPETAGKIEKIFSADKIQAPRKPLFPRRQQCSLGGQAR